MRCRSRSGGRDCRVGRDGGGESGNLRSSSSFSSSDYLNGGMRIHQRYANMHQRLK